MIQLSNIMKSYRQGATVVDVLRGVNLEVAAGASVAIVGASGSGKSTLLSVMACMDRPDSGQLVLNGRDATALTESELAQLRNRQLAIVFQSFELVPAFTALENVMLPLEIRGSAAHAVAAEALHAVGLSHRLHHLPGQLSGGEEQRVAIARALAQDTPILFADEPTGNLDRHTGGEITEMLLQGVRERKKTLVLVTHDPEFARHADRIMRLENGVLTAESGK